METGKTVATDLSNIIKINDARLLPDFNESKIKLIFKCINEKKRCLHYFTK
jgi:hypothetical protein